MGSQTTKSREDIVHLGTASDAHDAVVYLSEESFNREFNTKSGFRASGVCLKQSLELEDLVLPPGTVVVPALKEGADRFERMRHCATLVHEVAHSNGAEKWEARTATRDYLKKQGLQGGAL